MAKSMITQTMPYDSPGFADAKDLGKIPMRSPKLGHQMEVG